MPDRHSEFDAAVSYPPPPQPGAFNCTAEQYKAQYAASLANPAAFWAEQARATLTWQRDFTEVHGGSFAEGDVRWFTEGQLNVSYNCIDREWLARAALRRLRAPPPLARSTRARALAPPPHSPLPPLTHHHHCTAPPPFYLRPRLGPH